MPIDKREIPTKGVVQRRLDVINKGIQQTKRISIRIFLAFSYIQHVAFFTPRSTDGSPSLEKYRIIDSNPTKINLAAQVIKKLKTKSCPAKPLWYTLFGICRTGGCTEIVPAVPGQIPDFDR